MSFECKEPMSKLGVMLFTLLIISVLSDDVDTFLVPRKARGKLMQVLMELTNPADRYERSMNPWKLEEKRKFFAKFGKNKRQIFSYWRPGSKPDSFA